MREVVFDVFTNFFVLLTQEIEVTTLIDDLLDNYLSKEIISETI